MKLYRTYKTEIPSGVGGNPILVTVYYKVFGPDDFDIESITAQVYVDSMRGFVEGDVTPFIDEYQYAGMQEEIWALEQKNMSEEVR